MERIEKLSIEIIRKYQPQAGSGSYELAFSGGKDSIVLLDLVKKSGIKFTAYYYNTTIDPVGLKDFIGKNYPCVKVVNPEKGFFSLVREKGYPSRYVRWCCEKLKEHRQEKNNIILSGVRRSESSRRAKYDYKHKINGNTLVLPLLDWTDRQIWDYIRKHKLILPKYYYPPYNFTRIGCIGCPLASTRKRIREFQLFPKYAKAYFRAGKKYWEKSEKAKQYYRDPYEYFLSYLMGYSLKELREFRNNLFGFKPQKIIEKTFNIKL